MQVEVVLKQISVTSLGSEVRLAMASELRQQNLPEPRLSEHMNLAAECTEGKGWFVLPTRPVDGHSMLCAYL